MNESIKAVHLAHTDCELSDVSAFGSGATARAVGVCRRMSRHRLPISNALRQVSVSGGLR